MTAFCQYCDKQFANEGSLASHRSRFHRTERSKSTNSITPHDYDAASVESSSIDETEINDSNDQRSEKESISSRDGLSRGNYSSHSSEKGNVPRNEWDKEPDEAIDDRKRSEMDSSMDYSSGSENEDVDGSDQISDVTSEDSSLSSDQHHKLRRKEKIRLASFNDRLMKILDSIELLLQRQDCKEKEDCFDLLFAYTLKKNVFAELGDFFKERGEEMNRVLSEKELIFIDALLATSNLTDLAKLMNENSRMVKSMLEEHVIKRNKRRKYG